MADKPTLTVQDLRRLKAPFAASDHEILRGYVYLKEEAITDRIEEVDPAWNWRIQEIITRDSAGDKPSQTITVVGELLIKGVARTNTGMATTEQTNPRVDKETGEVVSPSSEANEAEKSATTDSLKRAARLFGIGRYILSMGKMNSTDQIAKWLMQTYGDAAIIGKAAWWPRIKSDAELLKLYEHENHIINTLKLVDAAGVNLTTISLPEIRDMLIDRKAS